MGNFNSDKNKKTSNDQYCNYKQRDNTWSNPYTSQQSINNKSKDNKNLNKTNTFQADDKPLHLKKENNKISSDTLINKSNYNIYNNSNIINTRISNDNNLKTSNINSNILYISNNSKKDSSYQNNYLTNNYKINNKTKDKSNINSHIDSSNNIKNINKNNKLLDDSKSTKNNIVNRSNNIINTIKNNSKINKTEKSSNIINDKDKCNSIIKTNVISNDIKLDKSKSLNQNKIESSKGVKHEINYNFNKDYNDDYEEYEEEEDYEYYEFDEEDDDDDYYEGDNYNNYTFNQEDYNTIDYNETIEKEFSFDNSSSFTEIVDGKIDPYPVEVISENIINVLMIAEKPSIARIISKILCGKNQLNDMSKEKHWCYFSFQGVFKGKPANFIISSVSGHIYQTEFSYKNRRKKSIENLFNVPLVKIECNDNSFLIANWLKNLSENIDILCLWLDCDREGENICYEVIYNCLPCMNKKDYQQIYRAIFSSLAKEDIINSFENIVNYPDNNLSLSVDARQIIDLKIGVSLTRFLTNEILPNLPEEIESNILSYGPCQTPTLWFCVNREREMEKENLIYYKIYIKISLHNSIITIWLDNDYKDLNEVKKIIKKIKRYGYINIENINREKRIKLPPLGLNTVNMLKNASLYLGYSPQKTMNIAQKLYMKGYITYPRTETNIYSSSFDFNSYLKKYSKSKVIKELMNNLNNIDLSPQGGIDAGDHPPITPSRIPSNNSLYEDELDLYNLIRD